MRATNDWGQESNDMALTVVLNIPEPATATLFVTSIALVISNQRLKRK